MLSNRSEEPAKELMLIMEKRGIHCIINHNMIPLNHVWSSFLSCVANNAALVLDLLLCVRVVWSVL